jgi:trk system potassium uptake protein TrkH
MRYNVVIRYIGVVLLMNALFMFIAMLIGLFNGMDTGFYPLALSTILTVALGTFPMIFVRSEKMISSKEGYLIVVGAWLIACFMGTMPYLLWGGEFTPANAWFESVSGYTTTGATILDDIEALPRSLLFWRSSTHFLGGIGVVMFVLAILPSIGTARYTLSNVQIYSLAKDNFRYRTQKIVRILLVVYLGLTAIATVSLRLAGMDWFDAVNHAFSTVATGGFSTKNLSIAHYGSAWIEMVLVVVMLVGGLHFGLIYATVAGRRNNLFRSEVTRFFLGSLLLAGVMITVVLWISGSCPGFFPSLRYGVFQLVSMATTTGFTTADSNVWPSFVVLILLVFSVICACAGSTSGGIKADRLLLAGKSVYARIRQIRHPNAIIRVKLDEMPVGENVLNTVNVFIVFYLLIILTGSLICTLFGIDLMTSFSIAFASMSNVGPGFGGVGPTETFSFLPTGVKVLSTLMMLIGRLEIFGFIQIFFFRVWK